MAPHAEELLIPSTTSKSSRFHASSTSSAIQLESQRVADIYAPIPTVFARAEGAHVWDPEGRQYLDFLSAYSVVNQGHCHPALVKTLTEQASRLTICSRAFYSDVLPKWAEKVTDTFGYEKVLPMCTGAEAVETAVKIARKWAYKTKKVQKDEAWVFGAQGNFHGRSVSANLKEISHI
jgi:ornithine--oxo-acid transaminase